MPNDPDPRNEQPEEQPEPERTYLIDRIWPVFVRCVKWIIVLGVAYVVLRCCYNAMEYNARKSASSQSSAASITTAAPSDSLRATVTASVRPEV